MMRKAVIALTIGLTPPCAAQEVASSAGLDGFVTLDRLPIPDHPLLAQGRMIWGDTCQNCHGGDKYTGAPKITSTDDWEPRIAQGFDTLMDHAIQGFIGPRYTEMPARGGNSDLTDDQVALAIAFMIWASGGKQDATDYIETPKMD